MKGSRSEAITLRTYEYSEAHRIAVFLTRSEGLVRGMAYGARKSQSRFGGALEPMTLVKVVFRRREGQDLATISDCEILRGRAAHSLDLEWNLTLSYFAELLLEFGREGDASDPQFRLGRAVLSAVGIVPANLVARYFELWLLQIEGVLPPLEAKLGSELAEKALQMMKLPPERLGECNLDAASAQQLERLAAELIQYHLEKPIKSRRLLRELI